MSDNSLLRRSLDLYEAHMSERYVNAIASAARFYDGPLLAAHGFRDDLVRVAEALAAVVDLHRPLGGGRHPRCATCRDEHPCPTRAAITDRLDCARPVPVPTATWERPEPDGVAPAERPALYAARRPRVTVSVWRAAE